MSKVFNMIGGGGGPAASIFVTGLSETDTVTATNGSKTLTGKWVTKTKTVTNSPLIPAMTSDTEPSGVASATKVGSGNSAYRAFDGNDSTFAYGDTYALPWTLQYEFPQTVSINSFSYMVSTASSTDGSRTSTHNVEVSLDGSTWETIWSGTTTRGDKSPESGTITLAETKTIKYIRWVTTSMTGDTNPSEEVFSLQVYGDEEVSVSGFEISNIRDMGTWTVTATDGTYTYTQDVLVDVITEYEIEITKKLYLYRDGDECEDVTGGWNPYSYRPNDISYNGHTPSVTRKDTSILVSQDNVFENWGSFFAENLIDLTDYSALNIHVIRSASRCGTSGWNGGSYMRICVSNTKADHFTTLADAGITQTNTTLVVKTDFTVTCDISSLTGEKYVAIWIAGLAASGENNVEFDKIWLE